MLPGAPRRTLFGRTPKSCHSSGLARSSCGPGGGCPPATIPVLRISRFAISAQTNVDGKPAAFPTRHTSYDGEGEEGLRLRVLAAGLRCVCALAALVLVLRARGAGPGALQLVLHVELERADLL